MENGKELMMKKKIMENLIWSKIDPHSPKLSKCFEMVQFSSKQFGMVQNCPKWSQMVPNGPKQIPKVQNYPKWFDVV